jgi:hypothetical protein
MPQAVARKNSGIKMTDVSINDMAISLVLF